MPHTPTKASRELVLYVTTPKATRLPGPVQSKAFAMPAHQGIWFEDPQCLQALWPQTVEPDPEQPLLSVLCDTGARVQELIDLTAGDVRLETPAQVRILGKGRKVRVVPLLGNTTRLLQQYIDENNLALPDNYDRPLSRNKYGNQLTRVGVNYILQKHLQKVREVHPHIKQ